jgi:hypothetical protein
MNDHDYDDRCVDEGREADIAEREADDCMGAYGVPYDPYDEGGDE